MTVLPWNEQLTTVEAERTLIEAGMPPGRRREVVDGLAALVILQDYLNQQSDPGEAAP